MVLDDIAQSFTDGGKKTIAAYSRYIAGCFPRNAKVTDYPIYILAGDESDPNHDLVKSSFGLLKVLRPVIFCFGRSDKLAVEGKLAWMQEIFKTIDGYLGYQDEMPVTYNGQEYFIFEPYNTTIDEMAEPWTEGIYISQEKLVIGVKQ